MDYGQDFKLDSNRDIIFTPDGDIEITGSAALVAQDIREELSIAFGSVEWDRNAGSNLIYCLNSNTKNDSYILSELERVALKDPRVNAATVESEKLDSGKFKLSFSVLNQIDVQELLFDLEDLFGEDVNE